MDLGKAFRRLRNRRFPNREKTQKQIAKEAGITGTHLSRIESGHKKPSTKLIEKLCEIYGFPAEMIGAYAMEKSDVTPEKKALYDALKPVIDSLIERVMDETIES